MGVMGPSNQKIFYKVDNLKIATLKVESFSWKTTINFGCPIALNDQIEVYCKVDRLGCCLT